MKVRKDIVKDPLFKLIGNIGDDLGHKIFVIGGWVRDSVIERKTSETEFDIVTDKSGIELAEKVAKKLKIYKITKYKSFGTAAISYNGVKLEFNGARKESYNKNSRNPVVCSGTIEDDQLRRDFTINAMAIGLNNNNFGFFYDPFNGLEHIKSRLLKTPTDPKKTFIDDPLRMMRAVRFATILNFEIDKKSMKEIYENRNRLEIVKQERITEELNKIILSNKPSIGFKLLSKLGLLKIFFPEFELLKGVDIKEGISHKDNFYHTLEVLDNVCKKSDNLWLRWSAILHDIAKPQTKRFDKRNGWTFHGHEHLGSKMTKTIFKNLKLPMNEKMKYVQKLVLLHLRPIALSNEKVTDSGLRRLLFEAQDDIDDLLLLCNSDITSKNNFKVIKYKKNLEKVYKKIKEVEKRDKIRNWQPPISGEVIMEKLNISPSKLVGLIKLEIREAILDGLIENNYDEAEKYMYKIAKKFETKFEN